MNDVDVVYELERRAQLNEQVTRVTFRVRVLVIDHVTQQVRTTLTMTDQRNDMFKIYFSIYLVSQDVYYRQHCAQRNAPVFKLLRGRF